MNDADFHANMAQEWARQAKEQVKNRFRVSAKLTSDTYPALMQFCRQRNLSVNSALRIILTEYFNRHAR